MGELAGWLTAACFALCGIPLAWDSFVEGHAKGISKLFLWLWFLGEVFGIIYSIHIGSIPLLTNYTFNLLLIVIVLKYAYLPRGDKPRRRN